METHQHDTELRHYGVKGMRWGIRKARNNQTNDKKSKLINNSVSKKAKIRRFRKRMSDVINSPTYIGSRALVLNGAKFVYKISHKGEKVPFIYNTETQETMKINTDKLAAMVGQGIILGDDIVINTAKGEKSITFIRDGVSHNILNCLDKNTDWFTLTKDDNKFAFTTDSGIANLQIRIENKIIYEGV